MDVGLQAAEAALGAPSPKADGSMTYGFNVEPRGATVRSPEPLAAPAGGAVDGGFEADAAALVASAIQLAITEVEGGGTGGLPPPPPPTFMEQAGAAMRAASSSIAKMSSMVVAPPKPPSEQMLAALAAQDNALTEEADSLPVDEVAARFAAKVMAQAIEMAAPARRPSLLQRVASLVKKEEAKPPPKPTVVDTPEEAVVREWLKQVFLATDQPKALHSIADDTITLRDHPRSGVVLCVALNALKQGACAKVKPPSATAARFARLEPLNTYRRACQSIGLGDRDCLAADEWLDGKTMTPLLEHLGALSRVLGPSAPKFTPPGGMRKVPTKAQGGGAAPCRA